MLYRVFGVALVVSSTLLAGMIWAQGEGSSGSASPMITGTVTYRARMALPADAAIDIRLEDVSRADAPAKLVAENIFVAAGKQVPIPFQLPYYTTDIQPNHHYQLRARITAEGNLLFTTTTAYPVITNGAPTHVDMVLQASSGGHSEPGAGDAALVPLRGTHWSMTGLNGQPPAQPMGRNSAELVLDPSENRYSGSTGCNRVTGTFVLDGDSLTFNPGASTMMACPEPLMKQEQEFTAALQSVTGYRIAGKKLELLAGDKTVANFTAKVAKPSQ